MTQTTTRSCILCAILILATVNPGYSAPSQSRGRQESAEIPVYNIVDTHQETCYDDLVAISPPAVGQAFYGQDAQYDGYQPSYVDNGDGTVTDLVTGLMWTQSYYGKLSYDNAVASAETFSLAGYTDWRLPTIKELYSLMDFRGTDPSGWSGTDTSQLTPYVDQAYFDFIYGDPNSGERIIDAQYWSSTEYLGTTIFGATTTFGVNFADGRIKGYPNEPVGPPEDPHLMTSFVRYVRGVTNYGINDFCDNGDSTVSDFATGLMWMQADSDSGMTWEEALDYAENLEFAGYDDWRLPNAKELESIVDYSRCPQVTGEPAIDPVFSCSQITDEGGGTDYPFYWSSTTHGNWSQEPGAWGVYVAFGSALGFMESPPGSGIYELQDVHGAGAQRSDPKIGDPADYPLGHGPQGDVVRIYNYVRCVRDIGTTSGCGDADGNGFANVADAVYLINYIFGGGPSPDPESAGDADCNEILNIADAVYLIGYIFGGGAAPCAACP